MGDEMSIIANNTMLQDRYCVECNLLIARGEIISKDNKFFHSSCYDVLVKKSGRLHRAR